MLSLYKNVCSQLCSRWNGVLDFPYHNVWGRPNECQFRWRLFRACKSYVIHDPDLIQHMIRIGCPQICGSPGDLRMAASSSNTSGRACERHSGTFNPECCNSWHTHTLSSETAALAKQQSLPHWCGTVFLQSHVIVWRVRRVLHHVPSYIYCMTLIQLFR